LDKSKKINQSRRLVRGKEHTGTERQHSSPEIPRVEGYINPRKRDGSKSTLEFDITFSFLLLLSLLKARFDDIVEHFLDLFNAESLSQLYLGLEYS
jgi:hypothetical protein